MLVIAPREHEKPPGTIPTMLQVDDTITPESVIMCDVCYEDFNNHEELLAHKKREEHW